MFKISLGLALFLALAAPAAAPAQSTADPEATPAPELVVTARTTGPAWWRISKGGSEVWVLGVPAALPAGYVWDTTALDRHLNAAHRMITPAVATAGLTDLPAVLGLRARMKSRTALQDGLPAELRARYLADVRVLNQSPSRYDRWNGLFAGVLLAGDFHRAAKLDEMEPLAAIQRAAKAHHVKSSPAAVGSAVKLFRAVAADITVELEQSCLADSLDEIEGGRDQQLRAAAGWDQGDVARALTASPGLYHCLNRLPDGAETARRMMASEADAIASALDEPGTTVAIMPLRPLVARGGILEQLKARGYAIHSPDR